MGQYEQEVKAALRNSNREFKHLESLHQYYEEELDSLTKSHFITQDQEIKKRELKKLKLQAKDRMAQIISDYRG